MNFAFFSGVFVLFLLAILYVLFVAVAAFNTWMIVDAGRKNKFVWLLVVIGVPFIGACVYYFTEKKVDDEIDRKKGKE